MAKPISRSSWVNPVVLDFASRYGHPDDPVAAASVAVGALLRDADPDMALRPWESDLGAISSALGVDLSTLEYGSLESTARLGARDDGSLKISIKNEGNRKPGWGRTRFSIAHELGHVLIRRNGMPLPRAARLLAGRTQHEEETLCHLIASEILMPSDRLKRFIDANSVGSGVNGALVLGASREFKVSQIVSANRFAALWSEGVAIYWAMSPHPQFQGSPSKLRVRWAYPLSPLSNGGYVPYHATAKAGRIRPNLPIDCYESGISISSQIEVSNFGDLEGVYEAIAIDLRDQGLFAGSVQRGGRFDVVTILRRPEPFVSYKRDSQIPNRGQLELFDGYS